jgi:hypothetical protein
MKIEWSGIAWGDRVLGIDLSRQFGQPITSGLWWSGGIHWGGHRLVVLAGLDGPSPH